MIKFDFEVFLINIILRIRNSRRVYCSVENSKKAVEVMGKLSSKPFLLPKQAKGEWKEELIEGVPCFIKKGTSKKKIFYLHGGSYIEQAGNFHFQLADKLHKGSDATIIIPIYPLAPHVTFDKAYEQVGACYEKLFAKTDGKNIVLMGDSAGAGFALGLHQLRAKQNKPTADKLILISPFIDITLSNPEIADFEKKDAMLSAAGLREMASAWAGKADPKDFRLSPIYGDLSSVKSAMILIGTADILCPDARLLNIKLTELGKHTIFIEEPGYPHDYAILPMSGAKKAIQKMIGYING